ncbi:MAG: twitching motility protein, partial [Limisphaerales bacterium]
HFNHSALEAWEQGIITEEVALQYCSKRGPLSRAIDNVKKARGEPTTSIIDLQLKKSDETKRPSSPPIPPTLKLK